MISIIQERPKVTMNRYGLQIQARWRAIAPLSLQTIEDQQSFFTDLGELVQSRVSELVQELPTQAPADEEYLTRVGRLASLQRQAEEIAMSEIQWPANEFSLERQEWESTSPSEEALLNWVESLEGQRPFQDQLETMSHKWLLPIPFLEELAASKNPSTFLDSNPETMETSRDARWRRDTNQ